MRHPADSLRVLLLALAFAVLAQACSTAPRARTAQAIQVGQASWYGKQFQGRRTASGEPFDMNQFTCAHPSLPFGTKVRITNLANGKSVVATVNDRGPYSGGRIVDVSYRAAKALDFVAAGTARVKLEALTE